MFALSGADDSRVNVMYASCCSSWCTSFALRGNDLGGAATEVSRVGTFTTPPYNYTAEPASTVVASVTSGAGAGKL